MDHRVNFWFFIISTSYLFVVDTAPNKVGMKAEEMCRKYGESVHITINLTLSGGSTSNTVTEKIEHCADTTTTLVIGGENAKPKEFPHMVLVGHRDYPIIWGCGGSLISDRWVLSAAHCTATSNGSLAKWVLLGDLKVNSEDDQENSSPTIMQIIKRINHPNYNRRTVYNDISLYMLERTVEFNPFIRPLCLNTKADIKNDKAIATGWGKTVASDDDSPSQILQKVTLSLMTKENLCKQKYERANAKLLQRMPQGITDESMICAGADKKDTCHGDSGGPLQIPLTNPFCMYSLIGITSFGEDCATEKPGVYTRVSKYIEWIEKIVWPQ